MATSGPWVVFEVADSELVAPLENQPAVVEGVDDSLIEWVEEPFDESGRFDGPAISWFTDPSQWDVPLARTGATDDIADAVPFLAGDESSWITGQCIAVDGGHTLRRGPDVEHWAQALYGDDAIAGTP